MSDTFIIPRQHEVWFNVVTVHGDRLEFVLAETAERRGYEDRSFYWDMLMDDISLAVKEIPGVYLEEEENYGDIAFKLSAESAQALHPANLGPVERAVQRWAARYKVNAMKEQR